MKKTLLLLVFISISITAFSQVKVRPGVKLGLNAASITNLDDTSSRIAPNAGLFLNIHLSRFYELQIETNYSSQGTKSDVQYVEYASSGDPYFRTSTEELKLAYASLAIANKFFIVPGLGLHLIIGPSIDINIYDDGADITPIDFSLFAGIGYEFPFGLGLEARYKQGFIDVRDNYSIYYDDDYYGGYDDDYYGNYYNGDNKLNSVIQFGVYYKFGF